MSAQPGLSENLQTDHRLDFDPLLTCLAILTQLHGRPVAEQALCAGLPLRDERLTPALFVKAAQGQGMATTIAKRGLRSISSLLLPAVLLLANGQACVLVRMRSRGRAEILFPEDREQSRIVAIRDLGKEYSGYCIFAHPQPVEDARLGDVPPAVGRRRGWFWGTLWRFRSYYLEALLATSLVNVMALATSLYVMNVYDRVVPNNATETLIVLALGTGLAVGFEFLARTLRSYFIDTAGRKADVLLASRLFAHALGLRMEAKPGSSGAFASQLREYESLRDFCTSATLATLSDVPFIAFFIWVISLIGGPLFWISAIAVPVVLLVGLLVQIPLAIVMRANLREASLKHGLLIEAVEGVEALKSSGAEGRMLRRFEDYTALTGRSSTRARFLSSMMVNFTMLVQQSITVLTVFWGVYLISAGELTVGALIACVILSGRGLAPLGQVAGLMTRYQHARAAFFSLDDLMKRPVERPEGRRFLHRKKILGAFEFKAMSFAYPGQSVHALHEVTAQIKAGEHVALLGRVGAGKSSLLKLLVGLFAPVNGSVMLDGIDLAQLDPAFVRKHIAYVDQHPRLFFGTLRDNLILGAPHADDEQVLQVARQVGLEELIANNEMGLDMEVGERGETLSGGQRQCVALARALLTNPQVVLMDEPTAAMDHATEQVFLRALSTYCKGRTTIVATHKPSVVAMMDRVTVLDGGRIAMDGPRETILAQLAGTAPPATTVVQGR
jgi:ATP-binding cassette subfamily C protein LapB